MAVKFLILVFCIGTACAQTVPSASDILKAIPGDIQGTINKTQVEDIQNKSTEVLKEKCQSNGGPEAYGNVQTAVKKFGECTQELADFNAINEEIEKARPDGRVDEVFKKYCDKRPVYMRCFRDLVNTTKECLNQEERKHIQPLHNVTEQLAEFICYKDGDRIALFIAEKGPECLKQKQNMILECLNNTFTMSDKFDMNNIDELMDGLPEIAFGEKECNQLTKMQTCVVTALETCSVPTSANIIESLFKFARKSLPCKQVPDDDAVDLETQRAETTNKPNSGSRVAIASMTITAAIFTKMLV